MNLCDRSNCFTQGFLSISHYQHCATKTNNFFFHSREYTDCFWFIRAYHYRNGHSFCFEFFFRFSEPVLFFSLLKSVVIPVSAVIDQSIRDNFHHILHAKSYQIIPGFAHLSLKVTSQ